MKSLITYYSFSGHTDKVAQIFAGVLKEKGEVRIQRLRPKDEISSFMGQCKAARLHQKPELDGDVIFDLAPYDMIVIGSPVWAFAPAPSINTYLDKILGLGGKRVALLLTSGSGLGVKACFKNIARALKKKDAAAIGEINIPDRKLDDGEFIAQSLRRIL